MEPKEEQKTALHKWNDVLMQLIDRNTPTPKNRRGTIDRRVHITLRELSDLKAVITNFEIRKQRVLVDFITDELQANTNRQNKLLAEYKGTMFIQFNRRSKLMREIRRTEHVIEGIKTSMLIVVNTLPQ